MKTRDRSSSRRLMEISNSLLLIVLLNISLFVTLSYSAPAYEDDDIEGGCYYMFTHYEEGDRILTNEPCLNCTCHNSMLMCYLRVCPFTKPIGQDCTVEKKPDQCCPIITCPEVPVSLVTPSSLISTTSTTTTVGPVSQASSSTDLGFPSPRGCEIDSKYYSDGAQIPVDPFKPCELCYCIRNRTACVMQECILHVEGCEPIFEPGVCCPVRYRCDLPPGIESTTTIAGLITTTVASFFLPTTTPPGSCYRDGEMYVDGSQIPTPGEAPCEHCYCMRGEIVCAVQECGSPLESEAECEAIPPSKGLCCPEKYACHRTRKGKVFMMPNATLDNATTTIQPETAATVDQLSTEAGTTSVKPALLELSTETVPTTMKPAPLELSTGKQNLTEAQEKIDTSTVLPSIDQGKSTEATTVAEPEKSTTSASIPTTAHSQPSVQETTTTAQGIVETGKTQSTERIPIDSQVEGETTEHKPLDDDTFASSPEPIEAQTTTKEGIVTESVKTTSHVPSVTPAIEIVTESMVFPTVFPKVSHDQVGSTTESQELIDETKTTRVPEKESVVENEIPTDVTSEDHDVVGEATTPHVSVVLPDKLSVSESTTEKEAEGQTVSPAYDEFSTEKQAEHTSEKVLPETTAQPVVQSELVSTEKLPEEITEKADQETTISPVKPEVTASQPALELSSTQKQSEQTTLQPSGISETEKVPEDTTVPSIPVSETSTKEPIKLDDQVTEEEEPGTTFASKVSIPAEPIQSTTEGQVTSLETHGSTETDETEVTTMASSKKPEIEESTILPVAKKPAVSEGVTEYPTSTRKPLEGVTEKEDQELTTTEIPVETFEHGEMTTSRVSSEDMKLDKGKVVPSVSTENATELTPTEPEPHVTSLSPETTTKLSPPENLISTESPSTPDSISRNDTVPPVIVVTSPKPEKEVSTELEGLPVTTESEIIKPSDDEPATTSSPVEEIPSKGPSELPEGTTEAAEIEQKSPTPEITTATPTESSTEFPSTEEVKKEQPSSAPGITTEIPTEVSTELPGTEVEKVPAPLTPEITTEPPTEFTTEFPGAKIKKVPGSLAPEITTETPTEVSTELPGTEVKPASITPEASTETLPHVTELLPTQQDDEESTTRLAEYEASTSLPLDKIVSKEPSAESTTQTSKKPEQLLGETSTELTQDTQTEIPASTEEGETHKPADDVPEGIPIVTESVTQTMPPPTEQPVEVSKEPEEATTISQLTKVSDTSRPEDISEATTEQAQKVPLSSESSTELTQTEEAGPEQTTQKAQFDEVEKESEKPESEVTQVTQPSKQPEISTETVGEERSTSKPEDEESILSEGKTTIAPEIGAMVGEPSKSTTEAAKETVEPEGIKVSGGDRTTTPSRLEETTVQLDEQSTEKLPEIQETTPFKEPSAPSASTESAESSTKALPIHDEISEASTTTKRTVEIVVTTGAVTMEPELHTTLSSEEEVQPPSNLTEKLDDEVQHITTVRPEEITQKEPSTTESELFMFDSTTAAITDTTAFSHMRIPGEGSCFVEGVTYKNGSRIPPSTPCQLACACQNSIVHCLLVHCPPAPSGYSNCKPIYTPNTCCPKYDCTEDTTPVTVTPEPVGSSLSTTPFVTVTPSSVETFAPTSSEASSELPASTSSEELHDDVSKIPQNITDDRIDETESPVSTESSTPSRISVTVTEATQLNETTEGYNFTRPEQIAESTTVAKPEYLTTTTMEELSTMKQALVQEPTVRNASVSISPVSELPTTIAIENVTEVTTTVTTAKYPVENVTEVTTTITTAKYPVTFSTTSVTTSPAPWPYPSSTTTETPTISNGACLFDSRVYMSAQQIPRDDPCDFCFCFRGDIICLQQSCPPPIHGCYEEPIPGFCCPRYECPVGSSGNTTSSSQQLGSPSYYHNQMLSNYNTGGSVGSIGSVPPSGPGCEIQGEFYETGQTITATSGPCLDCKCGATGMMECDPKECQPEPMLRKMIEAITSR